MSNLEVFLDIKKSENRSRARLVAENIASQLEKEYHLEGQ